MAERQYHLWRKYPTKPFTRFACSLEQAPTEEGYRVVDFDPRVADAAFMHRMAEALRAEHVGQSSEEYQGMIGERLSWVQHGDEGHFGIAVRAVPNAVLRGEGRP